MTIQDRIIDLEASAKLWSEGISAWQIASILVSRNVVIAWSIATVTGSHRARSGSWRFRGASRHVGRPSGLWSQGPNRKSRPQPTTPSGSHARNVSTN